MKPPLTLSISVRRVLESELKTRVWVSATRTYVTLDRSLILASSLWNEINDDPAQFTVLLWEKQLQQSTKSTVIDKAPYNFGALLLFSSCPDFFCYFSWRLHSIPSKSRERSLGQSQVSLTCIGETERDEPFDLAPLVQKRLLLTSQGSLPSGGLQSSGGVEKQSDNYHLLW